MLLALVPLFDENMAVRAYSIFAQRDNFFLDPMMQGTMQNDGAAAVYGLQMIEEMGIESISDDSEVFVSVSNISIFTDVTEQCSAPHERIVLLIDNTVPPVDVYINRLRELKNLGYKLAIRKLPVADFENYSEVFKLMDYVLLNNRKIAIDKAKIYFGKLYPNIKLVAGNISDMETFEKLKASGGYQLYEGEFYRVPVTKGNTEITPLKVNYIALMNSVNSADFDLEEAADIIGRDPALTISLLQMVNRMTVNSGITTIRHAAAMLGQRELRQWINTAVVKEMYADKPSEITRLSLLRAKFAEYLSVPFSMAVRQEELFLMGLVSVLDVILETSMEEALEKVKVTGEVSKALTKGEGPLANVMELIRQYENANWQEVTRLLLLANVEVSVVNDCYMRSLQWYKKLMLGKEE
ncbi:MAG: HDOD domain-containing protein [Eubacterium sp.]|nr:HDOD domain-containing protein [Eubacterium sp.]